MWSFLIVLLIVCLILAICLDQNGVFHWIDGPHCWLPAWGCSFTDGRPHDIMLLGDNYELHLLRKL